MGKCRTLHPELQHLQPHLTHFPVAFPLRECFVLICALACHKTGRNVFSMVIKTAKHFRVNCTVGSRKLWQLFPSGVKDFYGF